MSNRDWLVRSTLLKKSNGEIFAKLELRSEAKPDRISFVNIPLRGSEREIYRRVTAGAGALAEHQNQQLRDNHNTHVIAIEMVEVFKQMLSETKPENILTTEEMYGIEGEAKNTRGI